MKTAGNTVLVTDPVALMGPDGTARFAILQVMGSAQQAECIVTWQYAASLGEPALAGEETCETRATVRTT